MKRLDALIVRNVPNVRKAVKWNSPYYGVEGPGWFLGCFLPRHVARARSTRRHGQGRALDRHPRGRSRRGADGDLGEAGRRVARLGSLADRPEDLSSPQRHTFRVPPNPRAGFDGIVVRCQVLECETPGRLRHTSVRMAMPAICCGHIAGTATGP